MEEKVAPVELKFYEESAHPTLSLRFVKRDDVRVLQQRYTITRRYSNGVIEDGAEWRDVPLYEAHHPEPSND